MLTVTVSFAACVETPTDEQTGAAATTEAVTAEETVDMDYIPEFDSVEQYKGQTLTMLVNSGFWAADDIWAEEDSDDPVDSAVYQRNNNIMDKYGIKIECTNNENVSTTIQNAIKSNVTDYDVAIFCAYEACPLAANNIFYDLTTVDNLNLNKHYWDQNMFDGLSIDNKLFYITGDLSTKANAGTFLMLYNKNLASKYDIENLYDLVRAGTWTIDKLNEIITQYGYSDTNGDTKVGVEDTFGLGIQVEAYLAFYFGCNGVIVNKDESDLPVLNLNTDKNVAIIDKIYNLTRVDNKTIDSHEWLNVTGGSFASIAAFNDNRALFVLSNAANIASFRDMESDFGVLPTPKYDADQTDYYSYVYHGVSLFTIPINNKHIDFTGFALEALAAESYQLVTPAYYEQTLKGKYQRDSDSYEMMDIAFRNRVWDLGYFARFAGLDDKVITQIKLGSSSFASFYKKIEKSTNTAIKKYINSYESSSQT